MGYDTGKELAIGRKVVLEMTRHFEANEEHRNFRWETFTDAFIEEIREAKVFVDCGAEFGFYIRLALKYGRPDLHVIAFEPEPARYEVLKEAFGDHNNVDIHPYAVSNANTTRTVTKPGQGASLTFASKVPDRFPAAGQSTMSIASVVLDEVLDETEVDVLKMDIEGAEVLAFQGMTRLLTQGRASLFVEFHVSYIPAIEPDGLAMLQRMLDDAGYRAFDGYGRACTIVAGRVVLRPPSKWDTPWPPRRLRRIDASRPASAIVGQLHELATSTAARTLPSASSQPESDRGAP